MTTSLFSWAMATVLCGAVCAASAAPADPVVPSDAKTAAEVCEAAVTQAIQKSRGPKAKQVQFVSPKRAAQPAPGASNFESSVQGDGRYQGTDGTMPFTYSCTLDPHTRSTTGLIFKETGDPVRLVEKPWQADLTHIAPEVCETAVAAAIKDTYPRAVNVALSSRDRQLMPAPNAHTYLHGQGRMERALGMQPSAFTYRCEIDTASGKLLGVQTDLVE